MSKNKKPKSTFGVVMTVIVVVIVFFMLGPLYIVDEGSQAVITRFGAIVETRRDAGLYLKIPLIDSVTIYPKRILSLDGDPRSAPTKENQFVVVDTTSRWRIVDPAQFYRSLTSLGTANVSLSDIIDSSVRRIIAQNSLREIVRSSDLILQKGAITPETDTEAAEMEMYLGEAAEPNAAEQAVVKGRRLLSNEMAQEARSIEKEYGIELIDVVPRQIKYADELTESVYNRMIKERNQVAQRNRSRGEGERSNWLGRLENDLLKIQSEAYSKSEEIKGRADAEASAIYAEAYSKDASFYAFWKSMESYRTTMGKFDSTLSTNMDYFDYLYSPTGR
jgi:membrane protease subunit HflC